MIPINGKCQYCSESESLFIPGTIMCVLFFSHFRDIDLMCSRKNRNPNHTDCLLYAENMVQSKHSCRYTPDSGNMHQSYSECTPTNICKESCQLSASRLIPKREQDMPIWHKEFSGEMKISTSSTLPCIFYTTTWCDKCFQRGPRLCHWPLKILITTLFCQKIEHKKTDLHKTT